MFSFIVCTLFLVFWTRKLVLVLKNVAAARATGLPYIITPALETEIIGHMMTPLLRKYYHRRLLQGRGWPRWCRFIVREWSWEDRGRSHAELGDVFIAVSPEGLICYSTDAILNADVTSRRLEFVKPPDKYKILESFGPNLATVEGRSFRIHSRITAPAFNTRSGVDAIVWDETARQTRSLMTTWSRAAPTALHSDITALSLATFLCAGYGRTTEWAILRDFGKTSGDAKNHWPGIHEAVMGVLTNMVSILLLPEWILRLTVPQAATAYGNLKAQFTSMINEERAHIIAQKGPNSRSETECLLTSVVRSSLFAKDEEGIATGEKDRTLSDKEIMGNLFIFLIGGIETTANSILYGMIALALYDDIQERVIQSVDLLHKSSSITGQPIRYSEDVEGMKYINAFMYEILRVFPGVLWITKMIQTPTAVSLSDSKMVKLPANCRIYLNVTGTQRSPRYWAEPNRFNPDRWRDTIDRDPLRRLTGKFIGFSDGARACPGRIFAYHEFVAFFVTLLRDYRITLGDGLDRDIVEKDVFWRHAGKLTLSPLPHISVRLAKRI
ncbi:putative cytochrome P450 oxidoreductase [Phaeosphaeria sp. MPI-PUGE-AT-0046c]|nr:putative cytochrome P450 oxidoreductase [Phaeosphaeria sp. MPI-PUGE-AT-0046c]